MDSTHRSASQAKGRFQRLTFRDVFVLKSSMKPDLHQSHFGPFLEHDATGDNTLYRLHRLLMISFVPYERYISCPETSQCFLSKWQILGSVVQGSLSFVNTEALMVLI